jgi:4-amino-4-deoxy-L-arabinose transferase-like glycosyltransferase
MSHGVCVLEGTEAMVERPKVAARLPKPHKQLNLSTSNKHLTNFNITKGNSMNSRPRFLWVLPILMVAASFAIRVAAWVYWGTGSIESEGAEYAKIAENLRNGIGYVGLVSPGPEVLFNPLFPWLIAAASFLTYDYETAGRLVALIVGAFLPLPVFGIASRLFNRPVGMIAGALALLHPLSVYLSFMVLSEGPYATILLFAVYLVVRALDESSTRPWLLVGGAFGLCYLLRAEALAAFVISVLFALIATEGNRTHKCKRAAYAIVVFLAFASPEIIFIYKSTGRVLFEGKSTILFSYTGKRILAAETKPGVDYVSAGGRHDVPSPAPNTEGGYTWEAKWAFYGIDSDLNGTGVAMRSFTEVVREGQNNLRDVFPLLLGGLLQSIPRLFFRLSSSWLGAPLLPALALLGALRRPWHGPQATTRFYVMLVSAAPVAATLFVLWGDVRYYFIFVPFLCIWAANGLFEIGLWIKASSAAAGWNILVRSAVSQWIFPGLLALAMIVSPIKQVRNQFSDSAPPTRVEKEIGLWIGRQQSRPVRIMDNALPLSFHAGAGQHVYFPYSTGELALRYLDAAQVDYIVLRRGEKFTQYYEEWLTRGIPNPRAELLQLPSVADAERFLIYKWRSLVGDDAAVEALGR